MLCVRGSTGKSPYLHLFGALAMTTSGPSSIHCEEDGSALLVPFFLFLSFFFLLGMVRESSEAETSLDLEQGSSAIESVLIVKRVLLFSSRDEELLAISNEKLGSMCSLMYSQASSRALQYTSRIFNPEWSHSYQSTKSMQVVWTVLWSPHVPQAIYTAKPPVS